jgi:uroporphyrin-III C-methyltransferase / precorrin-2 dehydrogenase / sirohydrochlorin ferrochelatase
MKPAGFVSIVGAGPGDPALLTRKAAACLRRADLVLYDALVDPRVVALARRARRFYVGKRAGRHALSQEAIHALMIRGARRGRHVVRLKGGDPFVFGRGGEEALALRAAGIAFDVIPGVTNAVAAPARAGIPVTHRGVASAFLTISGHDVSAFEAIAGSLRPNTVTLVVLMGVGTRTAIALALLARGWRPGTAAALVSGAWTPGEHTWRGTLRDLAAGDAACGDLPATIVIGDVAGLECASDATVAGATTTMRAHAQ